MVQPSDVVVAQLRTLNRHVWIRLSGVYRLRAEVWKEDNALISLECRAVRLPVDVRHGVAQHRAPRRADEGRPPDIRSLFLAAATNAATEGRGRPGTIRRSKRGEPSSGAE